MKKLAIIGSGIAGLGCAYFLHKHFHITIFERNSYVGGHTNTIDVPEGNTSVSLDTGFMVFNHVTYPNLTRLFRELNISTRPTDMSISVQNADDKLEWCGSSLNQVFGQRKNIFSFKFWRMLQDLMRFSKQAERDVDATSFQNLTVEEYASHYNFGQDLLDLYLIPMASAVWSMPPSATRSFPVATLLRFFYNHRFNSGLRGHLQWFTVDGGARSYVRAIEKQLGQDVRINTPAQQVIRNEKSVTVVSNGAREDFDLVIMASHADESLELLQQPTQVERKLLPLFKYQSNTTQIHSDETVMPKTKRCWAAWNYRMDGGLPTTHYWMNRLQGVSEHQNYFVSLNSEFLVNEAKVHRKMTYTHPLFTREAMAAQASLPLLNRQSESTSVSYCGSYFKYGFHEDAFSSALDLCRLLVGDDLWRN